MYGVWGGGGARGVVIFCRGMLGMWLEWIRDELPLVSIPEASVELRQLFERATKDYLCTSHTLSLSFSLSLPFL